MYLNLFNMKKPIKHIHCKTNAAASDLLLYYIRCKAIKLSDCVGTFHIALCL